MNSVFIRILEEFGKAAFAFDIISGSLSHKGKRSNANIFVKDEADIKYKRLDITMTRIAVYVTLDSPKFCWKANLGCTSGNSNATSVLSELPQSSYLIKIMPLYEVILNPL